MLTALGAAIFEWVVSQGLGHGQNALQRGPQLREFNQILVDALEPAAERATTSAEQKETLLAALRMHLTERLDLELGELSDPQSCIRRWLAPLAQPVHPNHQSYWDTQGLDGELVVKALSEQVLRGIAANARKGGALDSLADEQRHAVLYAKLEKMAEQLGTDVALKSSAAGRRRRPTMTPGRWGRNVSRPATESAIERQVFAATADQQPPMLLVWGTGGFGKTWLAQNLATSPRALETFEGGVLWIQLSEDRSLARLSAELEGVIQLLGDQTAAGDPRMLAAQIGDLTEGLPTLVVVDDAWTQGQVEPFLESLPPSCFRIITSRNQQAVPNGVPLVQVDSMSPDESLQLLSGQLQLPEEDLPKLLDFCGDWPLVLALVGGQLQFVVNQGGSPKDAVNEVWRLISHRGLRAFDHARTGLTPSPRSRTVEATMETSLRFLDDRHPGAADRYLELSAFQEDMDIPADLIADLWWKRAGLDPGASELLLLELTNLSLLQRFQFNQRNIRVHDVVRTYLRDAAGPDFIAEVSRDLLDLYQDDDQPYEDDDDDDDEGPRRSHRKG